MGFYDYHRQHEKDFIFDLYKKKALTFSILARKSHISGFSLNQCSYNLLSHCNIGYKLRFFLKFVHYILWPLEELVGVSFNRVNSGKLWMVALATIIIRSMTIRYSPVLRLQNKRSKHISNINPSRFMGQIIADIEPSAHTGETEGNKTRFIRLICLTRTMQELYVTRGRTSN